MDPFEALASSCSVSYRDRVDPAKLRVAFLSGSAAPELVPYLTVALNESPIEMLFAAVLACEEDRQRQVLENLRTLARTVGAEGRIGRWLGG
jgi:hypothetical protein